MDQLDRRDALRIEGEVFACLCRGEAIDSEALCRDHPGLNPAGAALLCRVALSRWTAHEMWKRVDDAVTGLLMPDVVADELITLLRSKAKGDN